MSAVPARAARPGRTSPGSRLQAVSGGPKARPIRVLVPCPGSQRLVNMKSEVMSVTDGIELRERAIKRLKDRRDLQTHVLAYVLVNAALIGVWFVVGPAWLFWPVFPLLGWGIGLAFHAWNYFYGTRITEEEINREMQHLSGRGHAN
jgi:hypothetical protein